MGSATIWERWGGIHPDSTFEPASMNSFNHYAYGAIGDWMYRVVAGLDTYDDAPGYKHIKIQTHIGVLDVYDDAAGYKHIKIQPHSGGGLTNASASLQTYYGKASSGWKVEANKIIMDVEIPANTKATIYVPALDAYQIKESGRAVSIIKEIGL